MNRAALLFLTLSVGCLEVTGDPHAPGGPLPLPTSPQFIPGEVGVNASLEEIQEQFEWADNDGINAALQEPNNTITPTSPLSPIAPIEPGQAGGPQFVLLQQDWEAKGCSSVGQCHDQEERTIVVKMNPDAERLFLNWAQIAPPEAGGVGVNAEGSVNHFAGGDSALLWQSWRDAGYLFVE